jgi:photosystem II stability/assembly factor-like uncharacterized protein
LTAVGPTPPLRSEDGGRTFTPLSRFVVPNTSAYESTIAMAANGVWYGGTAAGSVFRSSDRGATWEARSTVLASGETRQVVRIVIDPRNTDHVYMLMALPGPNLYSTMDGGLSWSLHTDVCATGCVDIALNPHAPNEVLVASNGGLLASGDGGATWTQRDARELSTVRYDPLVPGRVLAVAPLSSSIIRSLDGGQTWSFTTSLPTVMFSNLASGLAFDPLVVDRVLLATLWGIFSSEDGGTTWIERTSGINGGTVERVVSVAPGSPNRTFAVGVVGRASLQAYDPVAQRWSPVVGPALQAGSSGARIFAFGYSETAPDTLYAGGAQGLFRSIDGGQTWSKTTPSLDNDIVRDIAVSAANPHSLYVLAADGVLHSGDGGAAFEPRSFGIPPYAFTQQVLIDPENDNRLYVSLATQTPGLYRTSDGGLSWAAMGTDIGSHEIWRIAADPEDFSILYAATSVGLMKSTDSGDSWTTLPGSHFVSDVAVDRHDGAHLVRSSYMIAQGGFERSVDGGRTWQVLPRSTPGIPRGVAFDYTTPASVMAIVDRGGVETLQVVPDIEITSSATGVAVHSPVDVQVTLRNRGPFAASRVVLNVSAPRNGTRVQTPRGECISNDVTGSVRCDIGHVHADETVPIAFDFPEFFPGDDSVSFEALAREPDPDLENNSLTLPVERQSDLSLSMSASASTVVRDQTVRIVLIVGNGDLSPAEDVRISLQLPSSLEWSGISPQPPACIGVQAPFPGALTCTLGALNRHSSAELVITAIARAAGNAVVTASATSQGTDPLPANNSVSTTVSVTAPPPASGGAPGGSGGGGSTSWAVVLALATLAGFRRAQYRPARVHGSRRAPRRRVRRQSLT